MTFLGKAFTALILFFSVAFFTLATAVHWTSVDTRAMADKRKADVERLNAQVQQLTEMLEKHKAELAIEQIARRSVLAALQTQVEQMEFEVNEKLKNLEQIQTAYTELAQTHRQTEKERFDKAAEVAAQREALTKTIAARDAQFKQLTELTDQLHRLQGNLRTLESRHAAMVSN